MQRELTQSLGTVGATHVRFLFGFPFALLFLLAVSLVTGLPLPQPGPKFWLWVLGGAFTQILATALMLAAMNKRSFVVATAYIKTEPVQVAVFGLAFLGDAADPCPAAGHPDRHHRRHGDVVEARRQSGRAACCRPSSGSAPVGCSRSRRWAIAAPS